ncbi:MAG: hypothetical protein WBL61_05160 [Bryobacteraceae bacterium]
MDRHRRKKWTWSYTDFADRDRAMKFAMNPGCIDCVTLGFKNTAEIDGAIERMARVMA